MKPSKMIVVKKIYNQGKLIADVGTILHVIQDFERIGGIYVLRKKSGKYVCDYGSHHEKTHCKPHSRAVPSRSFSVV